MLPQVSKGPVLRFKPDIVRLDVFHPVHCFAVELFLNGDVRHARLTTRHLLQPLGVSSALHGDF